MVDDGEACDDGNDVDTDACTSACEEAVCGDGLVHEGVETCDEGDDNSNTGACTTACEDAACGDGKVWTGVEDCDDQNLDNQDGCDNACVAPFALSLAGADALLIAERTDSGLGLAVASVGDVDGDGIDDLLVGAYTHGEVAEEAGAAYLFHGPVTGTIDVSTAAAKLLGVRAGDRAGQSVAGAGDVNGDGFGDILVGAPAYGGSGPGAAYVLYGPLSGTISLASADAILVGEAPGDNAGSDVAAAGDVDGDGFDDLLVGAMGHGSLAPGGGAVYVVRGPVAGNVSLGQAHARIRSGNRDAYFGGSVAGGADVDADGVLDIVVGAYGGQGDVWVFSGTAAGDLGTPDATAHLDTMTAGDWDSFGYDVGIAGDLNGDGVGDVVVGAMFAELAHGMAYAFEGPLAGEVSGSAAAARLRGDADDWAGSSVAGAGDANGDGFDDLIVGAYARNEAGPEAGAAYVLYGPVAGNVALGAEANVRLLGATAGEAAGASVASGDLDGDGYSDLIVGASSRDGGGAVYVMYGPLTP